MESELSSDYTKDVMRNILPVAQGISLPQRIDYRGATKRYWYQRDYLPISSHILLSIRTHIRYIIVSLLIYLIYCNDQTCTNTVKKAEVKGDVGFQKALFKSTN
jgi:hypothetical protein